MGARQSKTAKICERLMLQYIFISAYPKCIYTNEATIPPVYVLSYEVQKFERNKWMLFVFCFIWNGKSCSIIECKESLKDLWNW